jgi:hypothetical protein
MSTHSITPHNSARRGARVHHAHNAGGVTPAPHAQRTQHRQPPSSSHLRIAARAFFQTSSPSPSSLAPMYACAIKDPHRGCAVDEIKQQTDMRPAHSTSGSVQVSSVRTLALFKIISYTYHPHMSVHSAAHSLLRARYARLQSIMANMQFSARIFRSFSRKPSSSFDFVYHARQAQLKCYPMCSSP